MSFADVSEAAGIDRYSPILGRGLSVGDFDNDGKSDVLIVDNDGAPLLLHNRTRHPGNWIGIRFVGGSSNRNAYGAVVTARAGGRLLTRHCHSDGSYMSASDSRLRIGLGDALRAEEISVRWPSGRRTALKNVLSGRYITMREAELEE